MAYKKQVQGRSYPHLYNATMTVGSCKPNKRDDVMLVQYLLKRVYQQGHNCNPQLNQANGTAELCQSTAEVKP